MTDIRVQEATYYHSWPDRAVTGVASVDLYVRAEFSRAVISHMMLVFDARIEPIRTLRRNCHTLSDGASFGEVYGG